MVPWVWLWVLAAVPDAGVTGAPVSPEPAPVCAGEYADDLGVLSPKVRDFELQPQQPYTFCLRTTATYECPSYGPDGNLRRVRRKATAHGTAFAYRQVNGETLLLTNQHVAEWPAVTDEDHPVDDVPSGCKRVADGLKIVDNDSDAYERDDIPLTRVVSDPQLDVSIVKAKVPLAVMPWRVGHSAGLKERNAVDVRGFPLGAFKATNVGKVVSAYDHDEYKDWDHDDFVVDALLSPGNSGSPVFAVSCKTAEFELVGIYHAGYSRGSALNVVVGIDQVRDMMVSLKRTPRARADAPVALNQDARATVFQQSLGTVEPFFSFGALPAAVRPRADGSLLFEVFSREFPMKGHALMAVEDLPPLAPDGFGELGRIWFGNPQGLKTVSKADLDADTQAQVSKILEAVRRDAVMAFAYRTQLRAADNSREHFDQIAKTERAIRRLTQSQLDLSQAANDLSDHFGPVSTDAAVSLAEVLASAPLPPAPPAPDALPPAPSAVAATASPLAQPPR